MGVSSIGGLSWVAGPRGKVGKMRDRGDSSVSGKWRSRFGLASRTDMGCLLDSSIERLHTWPFRRGARE